MKRNYILFVGFILMVLAQIYAPAAMIIGNERIISAGTAYKFRTEPIDPNDPFRGKYVHLEFSDNIFPYIGNNSFSYKELGYVSIGVDEAGWAKITDITKEPPVSGEDYFSATIRQFQQTNAVDFPFDRYYMEESKAYQAELLYREANRDSTQTSYAVVYLLDGKYVLEDVMIEGVSIKELVE